MKTRRFVYTLCLLNIVMVDAWMVLKVHKSIVDINVFDGSPQEPGDDEASTACVQQCILEKGMLQCTALPHLKCYDSNDNIMTII